MPTLGSHVIPIQKSPAGTAIRVNVHVPLTQVSFVHKLSSSHMVAVCLHPIELTQ